MISSPRRASVVQRGPVDIANEERIAAAVGTRSTPQRPNRDIWSIDIARNVTTGQTFDPGTDGAPVWAPDSTRIAFTVHQSSKSEADVWALPMFGDRFRLMALSGCFRLRVELL